MDLPVRARYSRYRGDRTRTCNPRFWRPVLCQLSYAPWGSRLRLYPGGFGILGAVRPPGQRRALGALFLVLALALAGVAAAAADAARNEAGLAVIAFAAAALALWLALLAFRALRPR